jgi:hypothetical protein
MRPLTPAQAGFPPASRDFSRQAASGNTLSHQVRRSDARNSHATRVLRAYPQNCNLFACGVIAVRAAGLFG